MNKPESLTLAQEVPAPALRARLEGSIGRATSTLLGLQTPGRPLGIRARGRRHHPRRVCAAEAFSGRAGAGGCGGKDRRLSAPHPGRAWRLAAVPRGRLQYQRQREGLFRLEDHRRSHRSTPYAPRARGDPGPWRRRHQQCLHPLPARLVRRHSLARRAGDAGGDHASAALVSLPSLQGLVLGAHGAGAFAGADDAEASGAQSARHRDSRSCSPCRRNRCAAGPRGPIRCSPGRRSSACSMRSCIWSSRGFPKASENAPSTRLRPSPSSG